MATAPVQVETSQVWVSFSGAPSAETNPHTWEMSFWFILRAMSLSQLATDVAKRVFTCLVGVKIVSSEHRTTGGDSSVLGGSLGLLAGVIARLVQAPGVAAVNSLLDVVQRCEKWQLYAGADCVVQATIGGKNARCVERRLLEDLLLQIATKWCASCQDG